MRKPFDTNQDRLKSSILYGSVLGDASINQYGSVQFRQSLQKIEYIQWLYKNLVDFTTGNGLSYFSQYDYRTKKVYLSCGFATRRVFLKYRTLFYPTGRKLLPESFAEDFNRVALAVWYMDDGARTSKTEKAVYFTLDSFTVQEIECIQQVFREKFGIDTTFQKAGKTSKGTPQHRIRVGVKSYPAFYDHIYPIVSQVEYMKRSKLPDPKDF